MPLYSFKCSGCGHVVERLQKYDDTPPYCELCDELFPDETPYMDRQIGRCSFVLKGTGWAADGYAGK